MGVKRGGGARWLLSAPLLIFLVVFVAYPLGLGIWTALTNKSVLVTDTQFVGLDNITTTLNDGRFWSSVRFTVTFASITTLATLVTGYGLATLVNRRFPGRRVLFTLLLMPIMIAPALIGVMFSLLLNDNIGAIPELAFELFGNQISLFDPDWTVQLLVVLDILQWTPFTFLIMYANLQSVPGAVIEAARIDGATSWQLNRHVIIPLMIPSFFAAGFLRGVDALRTFDVINVLTGGGPGDLTTTLSIYVYRRAFVESQFGLAAAASLVIMVMMLPIVPLVIKRLNARNLA
ncbi:MAG: sugar ABC transporter permease [bacterium]|nr:sugar ABC transporter permease [bacterium]